MVGSRYFTVMTRSTVMALAAEETEFWGGLWWWRMVCEGKEGESDGN